MVFVKPMASCSSFDVALLSGEFDLQSVSLYKLTGLGRYVINKDVSTFNFCCWQRLLKVCAELRSHHGTPNIFRCTNKACRKDKFSVHDGTVFQACKFLVQQILTVINLFTTHITDYEQIGLQ